MTANDLVFSPTRSGGKLEVPRQKGAVPLDARHGPACLESDSFLIISVALHTTRYSPKRGAIRRVRKSTPPRNRGRSTRHSLCSEVDNTLIWLTRVVLRSIPPPNPGSSPAWEGPVPPLQGRRLQERIPRTPPIRDRQLTSFKCIKRRSKKRDSHGRG